MLICRKAGADTPLAEVEYPGKDRGPSRGGASRGVTNEPSQRKRLLPPASFSTFQKSLTHTRQYEST